MKRWWTQFGFACLLVAAVWCLRAPGLGRVAWSVDEGVTITMAEQIRHGALPFRDSVDHRTPLVPMLKAAVLGAAGDWNIRAVRATVSLLLGLAAVLLWRLGRRLGDEAAGAAGAMVFVVLGFVLMGVEDTMAAHVGWFTVFFSSLGYWLFAVAWTGGGTRAAALAGAAFGLSYLSKQPGLMDYGTVLIILGLALASQPARRAEAWRLGLALTAGFLLPVLGMAAWFAAKGAWADFVFYSWTYNTKYYVPEIPLRERWLAVRRPYILVHDHAPALLLLAPPAIVLLLGAAGRSLRSRARLDVLAWIVLGWCGSGLVATTLSGREFDHYSMQLIPALALATGWVLAVLVRFAWARPGAWRPVWRGAAAALVMATAWSLLSALGPRRRELPGSEGDIGRTVGGEIQRQTLPNEGIFVWGYYPELHLDAQRLPGVRFTYTNFLTGMIPWTNLNLDQDTRYAIVPGAWDALWRDWRAHPPALVVDTRGMRGYIKYPLEDQPALWDELQENYADTTSPDVEHLGYRLFRRLDPGDGSAAGPAIPPSDEVRLELTHGRAPLSRRFTVSYPAGSDRLELYLNGRQVRRLRLPSAHGGEVRFALADRAVATDASEFMAVVRGRRTLATAVRRESAAEAGKPGAELGGPPLEFAGRRIAALSAVVTGATGSHRDGTPRWDARAPSRLVYPRPVEMGMVTFRFGLQEDLREPQARVQVCVDFEDDEGRQRNLLQRVLDPSSQPADRGEQTATVTLPAFTAGRLILRMEAVGHDAEPPAAYWLSVRGETHALTIEVNGRPVAPVAGQARMGSGPWVFHDTPVFTMHAPAWFEFPLSADLNQLQGTLGLLDESWNGSGQTSGVIFKIFHVHPDGRADLLFQRVVSPAANATDRGLLPFRLPLPEKATGRLRLAVQPADVKRISFCYAFWHGLNSGAYRPTLLAGDDMLPASRFRSEHGLAPVEIDGRAGVFAHVASEIEFPLPRRLRHLSARYGLLPGAYAEGRTSAGATFVVEAAHPDGSRTEVLRRYLDPAHVPGDRGSQVLELDVADPAADHLVLRTLPAPDGRVEYAWSYWCGLALRTASVNPSSRP